MLTLAGITSSTGYPSTAPASASAMPVLPEVESRIVFPGRKLPVRSPSRTIQTAGRSLTEPPGLSPSSLATIRTRGDTPCRTRRISISAVLPTRSRIDSGRSGRPLPTAARGRMAGVASIYTSSTGDRWHDGYLVTVLDGGVETAEKTDVIAVYVDVHKATDAALLVAEPFPDTRELAFQVLDHRVDGARADPYLFGASGEPPQRCGNTYAYTHCLFP